MFFQVFLVECNLFGVEFGIMGRRNKEVITEHKERLWMSIVSYKGYEICPIPLPIASRQWDTTIYIMVRREDGSKGKKFTGQQTFTRREESIQSCIDWGKQIIDGKVPYYSVADL